MPSMQSNDVTPELLQRLATYVAPEGMRVLSLYLNLDPGSGFAVEPARSSAVSSLMDEAARLVEGQEDLVHDAHMALREDVSRARAELDGNLTDGWAEGAHALALFVSGPGELFEVLKLPRPVDSRALIADRPAIEPLAEVGPAEPWAALLLDGDDARLLEGRGDRIDETATLSGDHRGHEALGQAAQLLSDADADRSYTRIFVGSTEQLYAQFLDALSQPMRERISGRFDAGADWESATSIRERLEPLLQIDETHREREALDKLRTRGARGIDHVLAPLYERRVETLLIEPGLEHSGIVCPQCRWAAAEERGTCPVDGTTMIDHPNVVEWAVEMAIAQDADVMPIRRHNDLGDDNGIAAVLRF